MLMKFGPYLLTLLLFTAHPPAQASPSDKWVKLNASVKKVLDDKSKEANEWLEKGRLISKKSGSRDERIAFLKDAGHCMQQAVRCYATVDQKIDGTGDVDYKSSLTPLRNDIRSHIQSIQAEIRSIEQAIQNLKNCTETVTTKPNEQPIVEEEKQPEPPLPPISTPPVLPPPLPSLPEETIQKTEERRFIPPCKETMTVDVVSGQFYLDEKDLLSSSGLYVRRVYTSSNPLSGPFGYGWTLEKNNQNENLLFCYNDQGLISEVIAGNGHKVSYTYNDIQELTIVTLPNGDTISYDYDKSHKIVGITKQEKRIVENTYDHKGRIISQLAEHQLHPIHFIYGDGFTLVRNTSEQVSEYKIFEKLYTYDHRGLIVSAEQTGPDRSLVKRLYNPAGQLVMEEIFLEGKLLQQTHQVWDPLSRTLQIGDHRRDFHYVSEDKLKSVSTDGMSLTYDYRVDGSLVRPAFPFNNGLQPSQEAPFHSDGQEIRDPWGHLVGFQSPSYSWKASYDAFGRRLQTIYTSKGWVWDKSIVTTFLYDPEQGFEEIGQQVNDNTFWKIYGPTSCDGLIDSGKNTLYIFHDPQTNRRAVVSPNKTYWISNRQNHPASPPPSTLLELALN